MDLKIAHFEDVLPITSIESLSKEPKMIALRGRDFNSLKKIFINGQPSPYFLVKNSNLVHVQTPTDDPVREVTAISSNFTATDRSLITLEIGERPELVSGLLRLMQCFVRILLRDPGSDRFHPELGGGLHSLIDRYFSRNQAVISQEVALAITRTARQIVKMQINQELFPSEKLASAVLLAVYASDRGGLAAEVELTSQAGITGRMNLGV